ncbi:MAG: hypothetical protein NTU89_01060 [Candidatus Dependentiae bacterium]|nr:hypothetical protein [Candidatus Dependentiae bacterium]
MRLKYFTIGLVLIVQAQHLHSSMFLSAQLTPEHAPGIKNLMDTVVTYPLTKVTSDGMIHQGMQNRTIKHMLASKFTEEPKDENGNKKKSILTQMNLTVLRPKDTAFQAYPGGAEIFPGYPDLSTKFDSMIQNIKSNPAFIPFFRKVHINALNELYHYLMGIYVNFNLQHVGIIQSSDGNMHVSIPQFLNDEKEYHANKKTLIINHLINIIESQFNGAIRSYIPKIPQTFATSMGKTLIQNDYSVDLSQFIMKQVEPELAAQKSKYLQSLASYLDFFQTYTSYLNKPHPKNAQHFTAFVDIAEKINQYLYGDNPSSTDKDSIAIAKMDPPLFYFSYDDVRALKIIPYLAKSIPANSKKIQWPEHIVQAADTGMLINGHPMAYFKTSDNKVVHKDQGGKLYLCMKSGANLFEEELIAQPEWLNSWEGVAKILGACFGDFSALLGLEILDPCMESLVENIVSTKGGKDPNAANLPAQTCKSYIESFDNEKTEKPLQPQLAAAGPNLLETSPIMPEIPGASPSISLTPTAANLIPTVSNVTAPLIKQAG